MVCVLGTTASGRVCCSHANPLLRVGTRYIARKPASWSVGGIAQAQNSRPACGLGDPGSEQRARVRISGPTCELQAHTPDICHGSSCIKGHFPPH